jgi:hypothetical protein
VVYHPDEDSGLNQMAAEIRPLGNDAVCKHIAEERRHASGPNVAGQASDAPGAAACNVRWWPARCRGYPSW